MFCDEEGGDEADHACLLDIFHSDFGNVHGADRVAGCEDYVI